MSPVSWIALWAVLFVVTHLATTGASIRPRIVSAVGEQRYLGLYSLVSFATFIPLVVEYFRHKHAGMIFWWLRDYDAVRILAILLILLSFVILVGGLATPSPVTMSEKGKSIGEPRGILKVTRHPVFVGVAIWAGAHLLMNGSVGDLLFFGSLLVISVVGCIHQDSRKIRDLGEPYRQFVTQTSAFPGLALVSGRQKMTGSDLMPVPLAIGVALFLGLLVLHPYIFGGYPLRSSVPGAGNVAMLH